MNLLDFILAALPIGLLVYWMTKKKSMPSNWALPLAALFLYLLLSGYFDVRPLLLHAAVVEGILTALTPIMIVFGAILLFKTMEKTGAMETVRSWLNGVTTNRVAQLMIVGWGFSFLVEGVSGFGTPAALAAPLLVGLGFRPLPIVLLCLMMNTIPVSFGAVGMPTWFGLGELGLNTEELREVAFKSAVIHAGPSLVVPLLALRMVMPWREILGNLGYIAMVVGATMTVYVTVAFFSLEFPAIAGGICGLLVAILLAHYGIGLTSGGAAEDHERISAGNLVKATFPLWGTVLVLLVTRLDAIGLKALLTATSPATGFGTPALGEFYISPFLVVGWKNIFGSGLNWSHAVLYVPSVLPFFLISGLSFLLFRTPSTGVREVWSESLGRVIKPIGAFLGALVLVKLLMVGGDSSAATVLGEGLARGAGGAWQFAAVYLGALGSFFSGSNTVSNLTFGGIQQATAIGLGLEQTTVLALQSVGGAMGNMVCIHNIVAVCSILGLQNEEGNILRKTFPPTLLYGIIAGLISLLL
ncbi:L-lactate permease [Verrucomicrobiales bacterium BCK34]|nr:L-lactate permease [Verrucomicrobiales bacterium BCK34]